MSEALLDRLEDRDSLVDEFVLAASEDMRDEVGRVVAAAARAGSTRESVREAVEQERLRRLTAVALLQVAAAALEHARRHAAAPSGRAHPVRRSEVEARRAARAAEAAARGDADPPRLQVGGRLPSPARLSRMTDAELNLLLKRFGIGVDRVERLGTAVALAASRLVGAERPTDAAVERVLRTAEAAVRRELLESARETLHEVSLAALPDEVPLRCVAVADGEDPASCEDCIDLHDETMTKAEWESSNLEPGSLSRVCGALCRCVLEPAA